MKVYIKAFLITLIAALAIAYSMKYWSKMSSPEEVTQRLKTIDEMETQGLPDFTATSITGEKVKLSDFKGKPVILNFWASWCGPCIEEFPSMIRLIKELKGEVILLAVSQDSSKEEMESFIKSFPEINTKGIYVLTDEEFKIGQLYQVDRLPESFVTNKDQKLVRKIMGSIDWNTKEAVEFMQSLVK